MKQLSLIASLVIAVVIISGAAMFAGKRDTGLSQTANVHMEGDTQIIEIDAKGGYSPKQTSAKANIPTVLRVKTDGTYDCSSAIRIPSLGYSKLMQPTGVTEITVPPQKKGTTLQGLCTMGMYNFKIGFDV
jgi:plastocyanin domain-containing protein